MKRLSILGSTGSVGRNVLRVVDQFPERFSVVALGAGRNVRLLAEQVMRFTPEVVVVLDENLAYQLKKMVTGVKGLEILHGSDGYRAAATPSSSDLVISAMVFSLHRNRKKPRLGDSNNNGKCNVDLPHVVRPF
ncbi:MAG TPA: hypothetical protein EYP19_15680, partial [Desulfobacterales bacterium]|nr:hypothetical protein [Desulfobacterales bacterium]